MIEVEDVVHEFRTVVGRQLHARAWRFPFFRDHRTIRAIDNITFKVSEGEVVGFIGPNGAGKTTTLKILSGLIRPVSGSVLVAGYRPYLRQRDYLKSIAMVAGQKQQLIWDLPPLETLLLNKALYGVPDDDFSNRLGMMSEMLNLKDTLLRPTRKLSLGERMKCELIASLIHNPRVLFLDEPTIGLDVASQLAVRKFIADYASVSKATVLLTSHYVSDITALCRRVMFIDAGAIIHDGSISELEKGSAAERIIEVEFSQPVDSECLQGLSETVFFDGMRGRFRVDQKSVPNLVATLLSRLPIADLSITSIPAEIVISEYLAKMGRGK